MNGKRKKEDEFRIKSLAALWQHMWGGTNATMPTLFFESTKKNCDNKQNWCRAVPTAARMK
jgi:hypothetical protein